MPTPHPPAPDPRSSVVRRGGLAATHELASDGISRAQLTAFVRQRRLIRVRQGWYAEPGLHPELIRAARVGGRLSCSSALALAGFWVAADRRLHLVVDRNDCQLRSPDDARRRLRPADPVTVHWHPAEHRQRSRLFVDPISALVDLVACTSAELVTAAADSVLHQQPQLSGELRRRSAGLSAAARAALLSADGICESGIETLFWLRMQHLAPRRQVPIAGVGRVDFLFGDRLIVEVDGDAFHAGSREFEDDRRRDALLSARGYRVLHVSYHQLMHDWPQVHAAVWAAILRGDRY